MEYADILHVVWAGVGRDLTGSLLLEVVEFGRVPGDTYDQRLRALHADCVRWCVAKAIRPSTVEEWSTSNLKSVHCLRCLGLGRLSVDAISLDFPKRPSKAYENRVM